MKCFAILIVTFIFSTTSKGNDDYFNSNNKFYLNSRKNCQNNYYFDIDYFKCRLCDPNFNLQTTNQKHKCVCDGNSTELFEYDSVFHRPVCSKKDSKAKVQQLCDIKFVNATKFSSLKKSVRIFRKVKSAGSCSCDEKSNEKYRDFCIQKDVLKDFKKYQLYKFLPLTQNLNLTYELKYIMFLCKALQQRDYCNNLANLCVLARYDLDKNGPCYPFYKQQGQLNGIQDDDELGEGTEFEEKLKPFLFFKKSSGSLFEKAIENPFKIQMLNNTVNFTIVSYDLQGNLIDEGRPLKVGDLNLCNQYTSSVELWQQSFMFARNMFSKCTVNLRQLVELQQQSITKFSSLYLNYFENQVNFVQTIPILMRNVNDNSEVDTTDWQLVKRFYMVDVVSGGLGEVKKISENEDPLEFHEKLSQIRFVKSVEFQFEVASDGAMDSNKIKLPLLILTYDSFNITKPESPTDDKQHNFDFKFEVKFVTQSSKLDFFFQIVLPVLSSLALLYSFMQTFFYKVRQQKIEYDWDLLINFFINLVSNISNALFITCFVLTCYVFIVYKSQSSKLSLTLPLKREEETIQILLSIALVFKIIKITKIFYNMTKIDIFFIDFERPKYHNNDMSSNKSHPGTPSISSSLKLEGKSPINESVSAWRNYFIANEWNELITRRKISVHLHIIAVTGCLMVFGFENLASLEFDLHLNQTRLQNFLTFHRLDRDSNDDVFLKVAVGGMVYGVLYLIQRCFNCLIYERFIENCTQQFCDVASTANISVLILLNSFGFYIHGRSVHGRSDIDSFNMILQFKREEENLTGYRGLLPGGDQQTYIILAPKNLRFFYEKLINPMTNKTSFGHHLNTNGIKFDQNFERMVVTYHNINRFFGAFIDHALKDVDYVVKEKNIFEKLFDCEVNANISESKGVFYFDNGHSFDKVLFYGNENSLFGFEFQLFIFLLFSTGSFLIAILAIGIIFKFNKAVINHLTKNNLARKTLIDKRFLI